MEENSLFDKICQSETRWIKNFQNSWSEQDLARFDAAT